MSQKTVDVVARTFYTGLAVAGCVASAAFVMVGLYGAASETVLKYRLFFAGLAVSGIATANRSVAFFKYVRRHDDLPEDPDG